MRYELYLEYNGGNYQYFKTDNFQWDKALKEFEDLMKRVGLNMDNMSLVEIQVRRRSDDEVVDWNKMKNGNWIR